MTTSNQQSPDRVIALHHLLEWVDTFTPPSETQAWNEGSSLSRELVWTCIRHQRLLDAWIDHLSRKPPRHPVRAALWLGLAQLLLLDGIAPHAAVHETIEAAKSCSLPSSVTGFLNALLRKADREKQNLLEWRQHQSLSVRYSHPEFLINRWIKNLGEQKTEDICSWNQGRAHTFARFTRMKDKSIPSSDIPWKEVSFFPGFIQLPRRLRATELPGFENGDWYVQDPSTSLAPSLLRVSPGERVWDACAAPGGKTAILAEQLQDQAGLLTASDPNPKRLQRLRENMDRLGHDQVQTSQLDPIQGNGDDNDLYDAILLDVPCSNTGVLQRRPDAKWGLQRKLLSHLSGLQFEILQGASQTCKPGGRLVYSTCSIEKEETRDLINRWCANHPEWTCTEEILLLPGERSCDGCYAARLEKQP